MNGLISKWLNKETKPTKTENEFIPAMGVGDEHRKQFFTHYDHEKMQMIRQIKLNQNNK